MKAKIEFALTYGGILLTSAAMVLACMDYAHIVAFSGPFALKGEIIGILAISTCLLPGTLIYQFCRLGYWRRRLAHNPAPQHELEAIYERRAPKVCILIPSYREEPHVLRQTIMSAALAEYPERRIVVLIDDPPKARPADLAALTATRRLVNELHSLFAGYAAHIDAALAKLRASAERGLINNADREVLGIASLYDHVADWLDQRATEIERGSLLAFAHTDRLFINEILRAPAHAHRKRATELRRLKLDPARVRHECQRLAALFRVEITSFERKQYENLSHQSNKAMNLNAYIGLIGRHFRVVGANDGPRYLEECDCEEATLRLPATDYVLTLDADSLILPDYIMRLLHVMEGDSRIAVAQTPYTAVPNASSRLERTAGATTDIQYIVHQGFTHFDATYWVGANALIRLSALHDICILIEERGNSVPVFIQDRTVIEDTGSSIDLVRRGWRLYNYPQRLAYSATPQDFGALLIQRRRWSNGGLLIMADLVGYARQLTQLRPKVSELMVRANYLVSPALTNLGILALLIYPFDMSLINVWLPLAAAPYYYLYGRDLTQCGYRWADLLRVYALSLLLMPVNIAGVSRSLQQALTGRKAAFGRTPKVEGRTTMPAFHVLVQGTILGYVASMLVLDLWMGRYVNAVFSLVNGGFWLYGLVFFVGLNEARSDAFAALVSRWPVLQRLCTATAMRATGNSDVVAPSKLDRTAIS